jgi:hypothetical protein
MTSSTNKNIDQLLDPYEEEIVNIYIEFINLLFNSVSNSDTIDINYIETLMVSVFKDQKDLLNNMYTNILKYIINTNKQ